MNVTFTCCTKWMWVSCMCIERVNVKYLYREGELVLYQEGVLVSPVTCSQTKWVWVLSTCIEEVTYLWFQKHHFEWLMLLHRPCRRFAERCAPIVKKKWERMHVAVSDRSKGSLQGLPLSNNNIDKLGLSHKDSHPVSQRVTAQVTSSLPQIHGSLSRYRT